MSESNEKNDLTKFWLAWRATCDIRTCMDAKAVRRACADVPEAMADVDGVVADARYVMLTTNRIMADLVCSTRPVEKLKRFRASNVGVQAIATSRARMVSEYVDYVKAWRSQDTSTVSAFELVQAHLYLKPPEESGLVGNVDGRKVKDFLFEQKGSRPGGLSKNLWGYLLKNDYPSRLAWVAKESFGGGVVDLPPPDEDGNVPDPALELRAAAQDDVEVNDAAEVFRNYLVPRWTQVYDKADRLVVCGKFFPKKVVISDPYVEKLARSGDKGLKHAALGKRAKARAGEIYADMTKELGRWLLGRLLASGKAHAVLLDVVRTCGGADGKSVDLDCVELLEHFGISVH